MKCDQAIYFSVKHDFFWGGGGMHYMACEHRVKFVVIDAYYPILCDLISDSFDVLANFIRPLCQLPCCVLNR